MSQTRLMSFLESLTNVAVGYFVAIAMQLLVFPLFGLKVTFSENLLIGGIFTGVSILRSYLLRRAFAAQRMQSVQVAISSAISQWITNPAK